MDALIFDLDGVIVDTEPLHMACFREVLAPMDIGISEREYFEKYVGFDDRDGFRQIMRDNDRQLTPEMLEVLISRKTQLVLQRLRKSVKPIAGAPQFIREASARGLSMAVCSGSLRDEIIAALEGAGVADCFAVVVSADDVARGKPDPEGYYKARRLLAECCRKTVEPGRCVVCEDTPAGITAAREAGMKVCALQTTHKAADLAGADLVVDDFEDLTLDRLMGLVE